jgi:hypothetical protein
VNGHRYDGGRLSSEQKDLRLWYSHLLRLINEPAFRRGEFMGLNPANKDNPRFGRLPGEDSSGHWLYAFLRVEASGSQRFLVVANLHGSQTLTGIRITFSPEAVAALGAAKGNASLRFRDRLALAQPLSVKTTASVLRSQGLDLPALAPLTAYYFELE